MKGTDLATHIVQSPAHCTEGSEGLFRERDIFVGHENHIDPVPLYQFAVGLLQTVSQYQHGPVRHTGS